MQSVPASVSNLVEVLVRRCVEDVGGGNNAQVGIGSAFAGRVKKRLGYMEICHSREWDGKESSGGAPVTVGCSGNRNVSHCDAGLEGSGGTLL